MGMLLPANCKFDFLNEKDTKGALLCMSIDAILGYLSSKLDEKFFNKDETNLGSNDKN